MAGKLMHALQFDGAQCLKHVETPIPTALKKGEILLKLEATSLNPVDYKAYMLKVLLNPLFPRKFPLIPGSDVAGEVVEIGPGVTNFKPGDKVVAMTSNMGGGGFAEYAVAMEIYTAHIPPEVSPAEASCLPIAGLTAYQALTQYAGIKLDPNDDHCNNILITAASGGVGHYAVQLAKLGNVHVTATCGARNMDLVKSLGADEVLDYKSPDGSALKSPSGKKYDAVIHCAGSRIAWSVFKRNLSENGIVVDMSAGAGDMLTFLVQKVTFSKKKLAPMFVSVKADELKYLVELMKEGKLKTVVDSKYPLSMAEDAWTKLCDGHATGKIIVEQWMKVEILEKLRGNCGLFCCSVAEFLKQRLG